ncbi:tol-pal system protein YbgF [Psychromarinibacter sp. S121]|uniref:tol-pal system protein YbgF n=1 Tax=Psychromarinibacter sp. S121 TaxID=3415127 RepID=UPI003C7C6FF6
MKRVTKAGLLALSLLAAVPAAAQDSTLADIRQELSILYVEIQRLKRELSTTGNPNVALGGATAIERLDRIEAELQRLTAEAEQMEMKVNRVVTDGTNRIGDLEFRLCELEADCDIGTLGETSTLGGVETGPAAAPQVDATLPAAPTGEPTTGGGELAMSEQTDFDNAKAAYDAGEFAQAAQLFRGFTDTYPGGPLNAEAHYLRGEALRSTGDTAGAARAFLDSFKSSPDGTRAPASLLNLGVSLGELGQVEEACVMLAQVGQRFPGTAQAENAVARSQSLACQ